MMKVFFHNIQKQDEQLLTKGTKIKAHFIQIPFDATKRKNPNKKDIRKVISLTPLMSFLTII